MLTKEWFEKYKEKFDDIENFEEELRELRDQGKEFFEFEGVKIRTDAECEYDREDGECYYRFKCEENPFGHENLYLTLNYAYDSWSDNVFLYASFDYPEEVKVIKFFSFR